MADRLIVRKVKQGLWQWRWATAALEWQTDTFYTGDINLLAEAAAGKPCWLLLDGREVITRHLDVGVKDRKLLPKLVPYQLEESIVSSIDALLFAYGPLENGQLNTAFVSQSEARASLAEIENLGADIEVLTADYLELNARNGWILVDDGDQLLVKLSSGLGFSCDKSAMQWYLDALFATLKTDEGQWRDDNLPPQIELVAGDRESLAALQSLLPEGLDWQTTVTLLEREGGFWDSLALNNKAILDFRTGALARKLPFAEWWKAWKLPAIATAIAFAAATGTAYGEWQKAKLINRFLFEDRDAIFRQVVPAGSITDPVKQLEAKLVKREQGASSNVVYLMSRIGPVIRDKNGLKLTGFRYALDSASVQLNVEAMDFALLEAVRAELAATGLIAEIKNSRVAGEIQQAQIRVAEQ